MKAEVSTGNPPPPPPPSPSPPLPLLSPPSPPRPPPLHLALRPPLLSFLPFRNILPRSNPPPPNQTFHSLNFNFKSLIRVDWVIESTVDC